MSNNVDGDQFWTNNDSWSQIDQAVQREVGSVRVAQRVIPTIMLDSAQNVPADIIEVTTMTLQKGEGSGS